MVAEGPTLSGLVKEVGKNSLTVALGSYPGREPGETKTFELITDAVVLVDDGKGRRLSQKPAALTDVPVGAAVRIRLSADQNFAAQVTAEGPVIGALLKGVDAPKRTITAVLSPSRKANPDEKSLPVADDARIVIDNQPGALADIKIGDPGSFAILRLSLDQKTVQGITIIAGR